MSGKKKKAGFPALLSLHPLLSVSQTSMQRKEKGQQSGNIFLKKRKRDSSESPKSL
jgi:hypothetical protein